MSTLRDSIEVDQVGSEGAPIALLRMILIRGTYCPNIACWLRVQIHNH